MHSRPPVKGVEREVRFFAYADTKIQNEKGRRSFERADDTVAEQTAIMLIHVHLLSVKEGNIMCKV